MKEQEIISKDKNAKKLIIYLLILYKYNENDIQEGFLQRKQSDWPL